MAKIDSRRQTAHGSHFLCRFLIGLVFIIGAPAKLIADENVQVLFETTFDENRENKEWRADRFCRAIVKGQLLHIESLLGLPQLSRLDEYIGGDFRLVVEIRTGTESSASLFWTSKGSPGYDEANTIKMPLQEDGDWHTIEFVFTVPDVLTGMRIRFSAPDGHWEIRSIKLIRKSRPPISIQNLTPHLHEGREGLKFTVSNDVIVPMTFRFGSQELTLPRGETVDLWMPILPDGNLAAVVPRLHPKDFPSVVSPIFLYRHEGKTEWIKKPLDNNKIIEIAPDARMARLWHNGELFGIIAPFVHRNGVIPKFVLANDSADADMHFVSDDVDIRLNFAPSFLNFEITDKLAPKETEPFEGPAVRLFGALQSGLLPGVEFLKNGDTSSSERDIIKPYHNRSLPNSQWITMPFAVLETDMGAVALHWEDTNLRPTFASPNHFDQTDDHRVSLIGTRIKGSLEFLTPTQPTESAASFRVLRSYVARRGFPPPPPPLRTAEEQRKLYALALAGELQSILGGEWAYALGPQWNRHPFADMISTSARLTEAEGGRVRIPNALVPGGADITNDAIYFLFERISEWKQNRETAIQKITATVNADGSFLFRTRFPEWETAASSFGYTAQQALAIMEYVRATGNDELFAVVAKALDYLKSCDIPCGGFYWDTPFRTPDLQAAATLVWLYVWVYEYSGNAEHLERAKHFAFAGLPFVYQTAWKEHMLYGTLGKFGGTNRRPPLHFGLWSTRGGIQYAYALNLLSKYDEQTDWKTVALGILHATENLQYTEDTEAGCIPELFDVVEQERQGWKVNPCALVSLRWAIEGKVDSLFVLTDGKDRYTAPYPLRKTNKGIESFDVPMGQKFHILYNASRYGTGEGNGLISVD